jgi:hypothetical protein
VGFDEFPPYDSVTIETGIPIFPDMRLDYSDVSDFRLSVDSFNPIVQLISNGVPVVSERSTIITLLLSTPDKSYFEFIEEEYNINILDSYNSAITITSLTQGTVNYTYSLFTI